MRKVQAVITALILAAIVFAPAMGYPISSGARTNYSIQSMMKENYTMGSGMPSHEMTYGEQIAEHYRNYSIGSTAVPYSIKLGASAGYSFKGLTNATKIEVLGGHKASVLATPELVGAIGYPAPAAVKKAANVIKANVTAPVAKANVTTPAPVEQKYSIQAYAYDDMNGNGKQDKNETALVNWTINLEQPAGNVISKINTAKNGYSDFGNFKPGEYVIAEVLKTGWSSTMPVDGKYSINLTKNVTLQFGNEMTPAPTENVTSAPAVAAVTKAANVTAPAVATVKKAANVTAPAVATVTKAANVTAPVVAATNLSIKGMVRDQNQTALVGWKMELATSSIKLIAKTNTSAKGDFAFSNLNPGDYMVTEVLPTGWTAVTPADGVASVTLKDKEVTQDFVNKKS
jgi:hypothetical protein